MGLKSYPFPVKPYATCVKNQGQRGSCHTFASVAVLEETYAKLNLNWVNLNSWGGKFGDGGYVYLPWNLVRAYAIGATALLD